MKNKKNQLKIIVYFVESNSIEKLSNAKLLQAMGMSGKYKSVAFLPEEGSLYLGTTLLTQKTQDAFYKVDYYALGALVAKQFKGMSVKNIHFCDTHLQNPLNKTEKFDFQLGFLQGSWKFDKYLEKDLDVFTPSLDWVSIGEKLTDEDLGNLAKFDAGMSLTREFVEETPEDLNPSTIENLISSKFESKNNLKIEFFDENELEKMGMRCILAVGRASRHKSKMLKMTLSPSGHVAKRVVLVGKGLTYDSGGLDIKTGGHMKTMKMDMGGAATMAGVMKIMNQMGTQNLEIVWLSAFVENMVGGDAYKTDDILTSYSGQTIEVWNTDAEGRLTLADVLSYATTLEPDFIVEASTLTGACIGANSDYFTALMSNDMSLATGLMRGFENKLEPTVQNPLPEMFRDSVKGTISDLINTGTLKQAGHITAGLFLSHFVDQKLFRSPHPKVSSPKCFAFAHLDIAGSVYNEGHNQLATRGATGQSVRGIVDWLQSIDNLEKINS